MYSEKEIIYNNLLNELIEDEKITQEQADKIEDYVKELNDEIYELQDEVNDLEGEVDELEGEVQDLESDLSQNKIERNEHLIDLLKEITEEKYRYPECNLKYTTMEKILDRLEFILRYEV